MACALLHLGHFRLDRHCVGLIPRSTLRPILTKTLKEGGRVPAALAIDATRFSCRGDGMADRPAHRAGLMIRTLSALAASFQASIPQRTHLQDLFRVPVRLDADQLRAMYRETLRQLEKFAAWKRFRSWALAADDRDSEIPSGSKDSPSPQ